MSCIIPHPLGRQFRVGPYSNPPLAIETEVRDLMEACDAAGLPVHVFEGWRTPARQLELGQRRPVVTRARPWQSFHQYGAAVDLVFRLEVAGRETWVWPKASDPRWAQVHELAKARALVGIKGERPHLQAAGVTLAQIRGNVGPFVRRIPIAVVHAMLDSLADEAVAEAWDHPSAFERPLDPEVA